MKMEDELRAEYDLTALRVRKTGHERKSFGEEFVRLDNDVVKFFPNADAVNEALRFLIRMVADGNTLPLAQV